MFTQAYEYLSVKGLELLLHTIMKIKRRMCSLSKFLPKILRGYT